MEPPALGGAKQIFLKDQETRDLNILAKKGLK